jgi:hypothetical protein
LESTAVVPRQPAASRQPIKQPIKKTSLKTNFAKSLVVSYQPEPEEVRRPPHYMSMWAHPPSLREISFLTQRDIWVALVYPALQFGTMPGLHIPGISARTARTTPLIHCTHSLPRPPTLHPSSRRLARAGSRPARTTPLIHCTHSLPRPTAGGWQGQARAQQAQGRRPQRARHHHGVVPQGTSSPGQQGPHQGGASPPIASTVLLRETRLGTPCSSSDIKPNSRLR